MIIYLPLTRNWWSMSILTRSFRVLEWLWSMNVRSTESVIKRGSIKKHLLFCVSLQDWVHVSSKGIYSWTKMQRLWNLPLHSLCVSWPEASLAEQPDGYRWRHFLEVTFTVAGGNGAPLLESSCMCLALPWQRHTTHFHQDWHRLKQLSGKNRPPSKASALRLNHLKHSRLWPTLDMWAYSYVGVKLLILYTASVGGCLNQTFSSSQYTWCWVPVSLMAERVREKTCSCRR